MIDYSNINKLKKEFRDNGFVVLKNTLSEEEVNLYLQITKEISKLDNEDYKNVIENNKNHYVNTNQPLASNKTFWPLLTNKYILTFLKKIIDPNICFVGGDGMFIHRSATTLHRDSFIDSNNLIGPDFDPKLETLCTIRAATNLLSNELIVIPGSHKKSYPNRNRSNFKEFQDIAIYVELNPGDVVLFDAMLLHAGRYLTKPKYMLVWTYAARNKHTIIGKYYSQIITSTNIKPWDNKFIKYLNQSNLYWSEMWNDTEHLPYFNKVWKKMLKHDKEDSKKNISYAPQKHWSPYKENLY